MKDKIKIIQFGEGKFLRAFCDVVVQRANEKVGYDKYSVNMIQPLEFEKLMVSLREGDFKYTVNEVNPSLDVDNVVNVECVENGINPYVDFENFRSLAVDPLAKYVFSNTTESGIAYVEEEFKDGSVLASFPGKVLQVLYFRFKELGTQYPLTFVPCELIEENAKTLKSIVIRKAEECELGEDFIEYINSCGFHDTLVDRIVVGYQDNKFDDPNYILCEPFMKWVIDSEPLGFAIDSGIEGIIFDDVIVHRELKVKILNGLHTALTTFAILEGVDYVHEAFEHEFFSNKVERLLEEILATIELDNKEQFANDVLDRFKNPKLNHKFSDIMLNSVDKFVTRNYPATLQNLQQGNMPTELLSSLAAIVVQYKCGYPTNDQGNIEMWEELNLERPSLALIKYKFTELSEYPDATEFIDTRVAELRVKYEKNN